MTFTMIYSSFRRFHNLNSIATCYTIKSMMIKNYLAKIQDRITLPGAVFLGLIAILPYILGAIFRVSANSTMLLSSSGLLIVVGCVRDIIDYLESELNQRGYDEKLIR